MTRNISALLACLLLISTAIADPQSRSFSNWTLTQNGIRGVFTLATAEIKRLPAGGTSRDLSAVLQAHLAETLSITPDAGACELTASEAQTARPGYTRVVTRWACTGNPSSLQLSIRTLMDYAPSHIHFANLQVDGQPPTDRLFTRRQHQYQLDLGTAAAPAAAGGSATILTYSLFGFEHILIGLDHIAFLLTLMLFAQSLRDVIFIVTGFTLGHSITLSLAVLGHVSANSVMVEALIGFTIAIVAIENVCVRHHYQQQAATVLLACLGSLALAAAFAGAGPPATSLLGLALFSWCYLNLITSEKQARTLRPVVTTLFGLIHGLGFAGVLQEVGLPESAVPQALFGFNLGIELGQIVIVLGLALAGRLALAAYNWRGKSAQDWANAMLCGLGTFWFAQRLYF